MFQFWNSENEVMEGDWLVTGYDHEKDKVVYEQHKHNLIVRDGRKNVLRQTFNLDTPITGGFKFLGTGTGTTAAAVTQTALVTELIGAPNRLTCTNTAGAALSDTDIVQETSGSFDQKIVLQGIYGTGDNNASTLAEYGLFSQAATGGGILFSRFVPATGIAKTSSISVTVQITIRD